MILTIKKQGLASKETYNVFTEDEKLEYKVIADLFSFVRQFSVYDNNENLIGRIRKKYISVLPTYIITKCGIDIGTINRKTTLLKTEFEIKYKNYIAKGDILNWNFEIINANNKVIANITKEPLHLVSSHKINILNKEDAVDIILLVIAIEEINK